MYYYWGSGQYWRSSELFDAWTIVALVVAVALLHGVWRLWRGMRLDAFERNIRRLRQQPTTSSIEFPVRCRRAPGTRGFQISLLPLMLASCGLAMLVAQAQRPDDVSRPVTWVLFLAVGAWYGAGAWSHRRGFGPLRNESFAAIATTTLLSALLWGFYTVVDIYHAEPGYQRLTTSVPILLWWTAVGGAVGGLIGSYRANRIYRKSQTAEREGLEQTPLDSDSEPAPATSNALRKVRWRGSTAAISLACLASLVVHLAAVPHVYQSIEYRYLWWDHYDDHRDNALSLTMAPVSRPLPLTLQTASVTLNDLNGRLADVEVSENFSYTPRYPLYDGPAPVAPFEQTAAANATPAAESSTKVSVYVAKRRLPTGTRLTAAMFEPQTHNLDSVPPDAVAKLTLPTGSVATRDIEAGTPLAESDINLKDVVTVEKLALIKDLETKLAIDYKYATVQSSNVSEGSLAAGEELPSLSAVDLDLSPETESLPQTTEVDAGDGGDGGPVLVPETSSQSKDLLVNGTTQLASPGVSGTSDPTPYLPRFGYPLPNRSVVQPLKDQAPVTQEPESPKSPESFASEKAPNIDNSEPDKPGPAIAGDVTQFLIDGNLVQPLGRRRSRETSATDAGSAPINPISRPTQPQYAQPPPSEPQTEFRATMFGTYQQPLSRSGPQSAITSGPIDVPVPVRPQVSQTQAPKELTAKSSKSNEKPYAPRDTYPVRVVMIDGRIVGGHSILRSSESIVIRRADAADITVSLDKVKEIIQETAPPQSASIRPLIGPQLLKEETRLSREDVAGDSVDINQPDVPIIEFTSELPPNAKPPKAKTSNE